AYLDAYFGMFPTRATQAGNHAFDGKLEDFSAEQFQRWVDFNQAERGRLTKLLNGSDLPFDDRLDVEVLLAEVERELHQQTVLRRPQRDPLYWSEVIANAAVFLLVRDDLPLAERQRHVRERARLLPAFARQCSATFARAKSNEVAPELCKIAVGQLRATGTFYREGFPKAVGDSPESRGEGGKAAKAISELADNLEKLSQRATGSPRLGQEYATTFRLGTGITEPVAGVLKRATADLDAKRTEAAAFGPKVWQELVKDEDPPESDSALLRRLFDRVAEDRDTNVEAYAARWKMDVAEIEKFVREKRIMTLPDPLTLVVDRAPPYFVGQSVGGVYSAGPYAPEAKTILFLPVPPADATAEQREAFFRDFNRPFSRMIVPHELIPGHYVQLKYAAHHPHKVRAVFPDPIYIEGWGTFCERLLLDQGWGGALARLAHLKKQLENIARTIVDIRVHTENLSREEMVRFVKEEALQGEQLANNLWTRTLTSSPQITTYYLGYAKVTEVYDAARAAEGEGFELRRFMDGMMQLGPVRLDHYLERVRRTGSRVK
ncbi:MAG: DUF885 domain-containing protein, partial [Verrucomicrobiaceae bacterium]|nr:DUF885 domain-containing protein [Verrucomicrobiaceae bacterium]